MTIESLFLLSADTVCVEIVPKLGTALADLLPSCIKATILHKLTKRGMISSVEIFESLLGPHSTILDLSAQPNAGDDYLDVISNAQLPCLRKIDLNALKGYRTNVTDRAVKRLAQSKSASCLEIIFLRRCFLVTDEAVCVLIESSCQFLKSLCLAGCHNVTDVTLMTVAEQCQRLESIDMSSTLITDNGLNVLAHSQVSQTLNEVKISHCCNISGSGVRALLNNCHLLSICRFDGCPKIDADEMADLLSEREQWQWHRNDQTRQGEGLKQVTWTIY